MSSHSCMVSFCQTRGTVPGISYFKLTENRYKAWLQALGIDPSIEKFSRHNRICSVHFALEDILVSPRGGKTLLKIGAIPKFNLGPNVEIRKSLIEERNLQTVRFPTDKEKRNIWLSLLGWADGNQLPKHSHICSSHFDSSDVGTKVNGFKYLKPDATPFPCSSPSPTYSSDSDVYDNPPKKTKYEEVKFDRVVKDSPGNLPVKILSLSERESTGKVHGEMHQKRGSDVDPVHVEEELQEEVTIKCEDENNLLEFKASTVKLHDHTYQKTVPDIDIVRIKEELQEEEITIKSEHGNDLLDFNGSMGEVHNQIHQQTLPHIDIVRVKEELQEEEIIIIKCEDENELLDFKQNHEKSDHLRR